MRTNRSSSVSSLFLPHALGGSFFIVEADVYSDVAAIVAETAAEEGQAAAAAAAGDIQPVGEGFTGADGQLIRRRIADALTVHECAVGVDGQGFEQTILVQRIAPPGRIAQTAAVAVVTGADPLPQFYAAERKGEAARPVGAGSRRFGGNLLRDEIERSVCPRGT